MVKLFVYGTLRTPTGGVPADSGNHQAVIDEVVSSQNATLDGAQLISFIHYPGITPGSGTVVGELFELTSVGLEICDGIESHPDFYHRTEVVVSTAEGVEETAWTYWAPASMIESGSVIPSGDWFDRDRSDHDGRTLEEALAEDIANH